MESLLRLFDHLRWADEEVLAGMERASELPDASLELLAHVFGAELIWLDRIEGRAASVPVWPSGDLATCRRLSELSRRRFGRYLETLDAEELRRSVEYRNSADQSFASTVEEILLHVALHGSYHRGQVAYELRVAGAEPAPTDFIAFTRGAPAATKADAARKESNR